MIYQTKFQVYRIMEMEKSYIKDESNRLTKGIRLLNIKRDDVNLKKKFIRLSFNDETVGAFSELFI